VAQYSQLLSSLRVGSITLPNRMVMGAMHTRLETLDRPHERLAAFYAARARGEIGLILTGGYSPNPEGVMEPGAPLLNAPSQLDEHKAITRAVHAQGGRIVLQILHAGRYAKLAICVGPSTAKARINAFAPRALATEEIWRTIADFASTAALAQEGGYDGVEIMGSEGYLLNEFTAPATNQRSDDFGGGFDARIRLPLEIVKAVRARTGKDFMVIYRISAVDLVEGGMVGSEVAEYARHVEAAGADMINTGVGWHESAIPTIAASVPRAAWRAAIWNVKRAVSIPVMASNRINTPDVADALITAGIADLVSMARPLLADPDFAKKTRLGWAGEINTCIACNQACLDRIFTERSASCLVNPRAGREIEFAGGPAAKAKKIAVVGGGPAGMAFAVNAAERGHNIVLYETASGLGGQLNMARVVPGKKEFDETIRYFDARLQRLEVKLLLGQSATADELARGGFDEIILATGVRPREPAIPGIGHPTVLSYVDVLAHKAKVGERVAIIGAGGIGFDVAEYLLGDPQEAVDTALFMKTWGVDESLDNSGGLAGAIAEPAPARRKVHMFQRKPEAFGRTLGKSTGWIIKTRLRRSNVAMTPGVTYDAIDDAGLHYTANGKRNVLAVDNIILCAGQVSHRTLHEQLCVAGVHSHLIGGADVASELDAVRAIEQATRLAIAL
jgi:2,4-dienoyl-CoA reductase (NADPH2)